MENPKRNIRKIPFLLMLMLLSSLPIWAQQGIPVQGVILDGNGETVIGASVVVKGSTSMGTISDLDGRFQLNVPNANSVLVISYIGMKTKEVKVKTNGLMSITLEDDSATEKSKCGRCYHANNRKSIGTRSRY